MTSRSIGGSNEVFVKTKLIQHSFRLTVRLGCILEHFGSGALLANAREIQFDRTQVAFGFRAADRELDCDCDRLVLSDALRRASPWRSDLWVLGSRSLVHRLLQLIRLRALERRVAIYVHSDRA